MSHRHRSQCCCGDPIVPQDCFLGYGTVPPPTTDGFSPVNDTCSYWPTPYDSAKDKSRYHHWSFCGSSLNEELILSLERDVRVDRSTYGAYGYPIDASPPADTADLCVQFFQGLGINCSSCAQCCGYAGAIVGNPEYNTNAYPNEPFYVRYRRLKTTIGGGIDWNNTPQDVSNRTYIWKTISALPNEDSGDWRPDLNGGHPLWPLFVNPWVLAFSPNPTPDDPARPHGTAVGCNCQQWDNSFGCVDTACSTVPNGNYNNINVCNFDYRGRSGKPLSPAQVQLIGNGWDTNHYGYVSSQGHAQGHICNPPGDCDDDEPSSYVAQIYEQGSKYFWLQGIADYSRERYFKNYRYYIGSGVSVTYKSQYCEVPPAGLWWLPETLLGVFHRETWWEKYWNGYTRSAYETLNPDSIPPDSYFQHETDSVVSEYTPEYIGMECSGIPVFTWEIYDLYIGETGYSPIIPDSVIQNYAISQSSISQINSYLASRDDTYRLPTGNSIEEIRDAHLNAVFVCVFYGLQLPTEVTDLLEEYGILPVPTDYGSEQDYKIFKKTIRYYEPDFTDPDAPLGACCIDPGPRIYAGDCGVIAANRPDAEICQIFADQGYCQAPTGCNYSPCEQCVCANDSYCCDVEWDDQCFDQFVSAQCSEVCEVESACITANEIECRYILGGQFVSGTTCPGVAVFDQSSNVWLGDATNQAFCGSEDGTQLGSCCRDVPGFPVECNEVFQDQCTENGTAFNLYFNCVFDGAACGTDGANEWDPDLSQVPNGCLQWGTKQEEDSYFYGRPGGWHYIGTDGSIIIANEKLLFPSGIQEYRNSDGWNPWPFPLENDQDNYDPMLNNTTPQAQAINTLCCPDGSQEAGNGSCAEFLAPLVYCETGPGNQEDPETPEDPQTPGLPLNCSNYAASITCRGVWFQWQLNDYGPHITNPNNQNQGATEVGCDSMSNSFWLRQDPYQLGSTTRISIRTNEAGITSSYINNNETNTFTLTRGVINTIDISGINDAHEQFKSADFQIDGINYESIGFEFIIGGRNPNLGELIDFVYTDQERLDYENDDTIKFNPFEQLDKNVYTKSPDTVYWQIQEVFRYLPEGAGGYENYYVPFNNLSGEVSLIDKNDSEYSCSDDARVKYTGKAARMYEYQWYHPPYITVTGISGREYVKVAGDGCFIPDNPWRSTGQCCNTTSWPTSSDYECIRNTGRKSGPAGSDYNSIQDDPLPPPL